MSRREKFGHRVAHGRAAGADSLELRPRERVMEYLLAEFDRPELKQGSRLPTIRELSTRLNVSQPTVQTVFHELVRQGRIRTVMGSGTYLVSPRSKASGTLKVALSVPFAPLGSRELWGDRIALGIMQAAGHARQRITLIPLLHESKSARSWTQELLQERDEVDGLILFPHPQADEVSRAYEQVGKSVVYLNPPTEAATSNFVSPNYFHSGQELARAWRQTGRKRIMFVGTAPDHSISERLLCGGLSSGLGPGVGKDVALSVIAVPSHDEDAAMRAMQQELADRASGPDAICCAGDYLALTVVRACRELGLRVPDEVSIVGGTGLDLSDSICPQVTRAKQPFEKLGHELVAMLCERISRNIASLPGVVIPSPFTGGATTRPSENDLLGIQNPNRGLRPQPETLVGTARRAVRSSVRDMQETAARPAVAPYQTFSQDHKK
jgi:LacI family transcriptional regulator, repressor for deo operon, udp, cdd, tsx, nupC, and nupG